MAERRPAVGRLLDPVAARAELANQDVPSLVVVLHDQDGRTDGSPFAGAQVDRQAPEIAPSSPDAPTGCLDQPAGDGQPDACSRARPTGDAGNPVELVE